MHITRRFLPLWLLGAMALSGAPRPKLVLAIAIDQFRYDYLTRFRSEYTAGLDRLLKRGAVFTNAFYDHFPTVTAIGHATFLTGATPSLSGIVGNEWYDRGTGKQVTSVSDETVRLLGGRDEPGYSPRRLLVSTLGDEMKMAGGGRPRVISVSLKERSAVLPAGHMADGAYWFDVQTGNFVSSTFYFPDLPAWVKQINDRRPAGRHLGAEWKSLDGARVFRKLAGTADAAFHRSLDATPFGNDMVEEFAERAIEAEQLGQDGDTDLLAVSFSANDYLGHEVGPDAPEVRDISVRTDRLLEKFFQFVEARIGLANVLVVLTADHGVAPLPEVQQERRMPGGRLSQPALHQAIEAALSRKYGEGKWIAGVSGPTPYLNRDLARQNGLNEAEVRETAAAAVSEMPHIARVYTRDQLLGGEVGGDPLGRRVLNGFYPQRAGDLFILTEPYWFFGARGATHGSPYSYDTHVPVIFMGPGVKPGRYHRAIRPNDIAPTLAALVEVETPSGSVGRVLEEMVALDGAPAFKVEKKARRSR
ncbi:MAG: alkaline phosphatase family protein [Acidobacteriota bacterium]